MKPIIFSGDLGEFNHFAEGTTPLNKRVSRIMVEVTPLLHRAYVRYIVSELKPNGEGEEAGVQVIHYGPNGLALTYPHVKAVFRLSEAIEFLNDKSASLPTLLANDYISTANGVGNFPQAQDDLEIEWENPEVTDQIPNQRMTVSKIFLFLLLEDGPEGVGYYPEKILGTFQGNGKFVYNLTWDFFYELLNQPKQRMISGIDYFYDEDNKVITSLAAHNASLALLEAESQVNEPEVPVESIDAPVATEETVEEEPPVPETEESPVAEEDIDPSLPESEVTEEPVEDQSADPQ